MQPPSLERRPYQRTVHGVVFDDPYAWVSTDEVAVLPHIAAENGYTEAVTAPLHQFQNQLIDEYAARTQQNDSSVPRYECDDQGRAWWYYTHIADGEQYGRLCRQPAASRSKVPDVPAASQQVLLDMETESDGRDVFTVGSAAVSPDGERLLWTVDTSGDELFDLLVDDLSQPGRRIRLAAEVADACWLTNEQIAYTLCDDSWRPDRVMTTGLSLGTTVELFREPDESYWVSIDRSADDAWVTICSASRTTSEWWLASTANPSAALHLVAPRTPGVEYDVEAAGDRLLIVHNRTSPDFEIAQAPLPPHDTTTWESVLAPLPSGRIVSVDAYQSHAVADVRVAGRPRLLAALRGPDGSLGPWEPVVTGASELTTAAADLWYGDDHIRFRTESLVHPTQVSEVAATGGPIRILKTTPVLPHPSGRKFASRDYTEITIEAIARDRVRIPITLAYRRDLELPAPCVLYGYGAYEFSLDPSFSITRLSMLDRGVVVAYAHVRGGGEFGRAWYEAGRLQTKPTTFTDFVACGRRLVDAGIAAPDRLAARGFSAGGLTVGAAVNLAPELWRAVHVGVGFVDPLTSMLNPAQPLTVTERDEWGDPLADAKAYRVMASYSPYENVHPAAYPAVLATAGLNDQRVSYTEPLKWVARLRENQTDADRKILLRVDVGGHGGATGRFASWRDEAFEVSWLLDQLQVVRGSDAGDSG